ncbi:MAG TPA: hypothetical protein VMU41_16850 [Candidatus Binataceae bacterium]|nr:hypothetical protein [Candidatus Binataceae bacterium]
MRSRFLWIFGAFVIVAATTPAFAFNLPKLLGGSGDEQNLNAFKIIHVADLASMISDKTPNLHVYDANGPETRDKFGVIPGAQLLSSDDNYDVASTLPPKKDDPLVFYCANTH